jgi:5'(3')-deoxyribonucleotidase
MSESINLKVTDHGRSYSAMGKTYSFDVKGSMLLSDLAVDKDMKQFLIERSADMAVHKITSDLADALAKEFRRLFVKDINAGVRKHLMENKDKYIKQMVKNAKKQAEDKLNEVEDYYED